MGLITQTPKLYYEGTDGNQRSGDENYGDYQFTSLGDIVNNFIVAYVGEGKIITKIKRTDVLFHTKRAIQEFSFDTLPSTKAIEVEMGPALSMILPQDYVNYINFSYTDNNGYQHIIYPTRDTSNPTGLIQDDNYDIAFDDGDPGEGNTHDLLTADESIALSNFKDSKYDISPDTTESLTVADLFNLYRYGNRFGLSPEQSQSNGVFYIDQTAGMARFSSNLAGRIITLKYISDGLGTDEEMKVHKLAEDAIYKYVAHAVLSTRANVPEYQIARYKKEARAAKRNAKLRMSNLKIAELAQVMRNQSKWIKH